MSCGREAFRVLQQGLFVSSLASQFIDSPNLTPSRAVQVENTTGWNFKDLEGMQGNAKALKRNNWECKGILIDVITTPASTVRVDCFGVHPNSARAEGGLDANYRR